MFAFLFDSAGTGEWIVLGIVILIVVGPKRLPEIARKLGKTMETLRRAADEFKTQIMTMDIDQQNQNSPPNAPTDPDGVPTQETNPDSYPPDESTAYHPDDGAAPEPAPTPAGDGTPSVADGGATPATSPVEPPAPEASPLPPSSPGASPNPTSPETHS